VDDLDSFMSWLARARTALRIQGMSEKTVKRIVGPGAVWPTLDRNEILNSVEVKIAAGSSGRPNKALELSNFAQVAPFLFQYGNPIAVIEYAIKLLGDEKLDPEKFFPAPGQMPPGPPPTAKPAGPRGGPGQGMGPPTGPTPGPPMPGLGMGPGQPMLGA